MLFSLEDLAAAETLVRGHVPETPAYRWPLIEARTGCETWVKHENHTPTGAFKLRGGLVYLDRLVRREPDCPGIITATRGNHGQSIPFAARLYGLPVTVLVPEGNSRDKNRAMQAWGATLEVHGHDFEAARLECVRRAGAQGLHMIGPFHPDLVLGVATYAAELFRTAGPLDRVYVPIGMGSGICGLITVRDLMGLETEIIGVVAEGADAYAQSFEAGRVVATNAARTFADGVACRAPSEEAFEIIRQGAARVVRVSEDQIAAAVRHYYSDTHNLAEGAGAAPLAACLAETQGNRDARVGVILCGGNIDPGLMQTILAGETPDS